MSEERRVIEDRREGSRRKTFLVEDWKKAYKWFSVQFSVLLAFFTAVYELAPQIQQFVTPSQYKIIMLLGLLAVIIGRLKNQP